MLEAGFSLPVKESGFVEETGEPLHKHAYMFVQIPLKFMIIVLTLIIIDFYGRQSIDICKAEAVHCWQLYCQQ